MLLRGAGVDVEGDVYLTVVLTMFYVRRIPTRGVTGAGRGPTIGTCSSSLSTLDTSCFTCFEL